MSNAMSMFDALEQVGGGTPIFIHMNHPDIYTVGCYVVYGFDYPSFSHWLVPGTIDHPITEFFMVDEI